MQFSDDGKTALDILDEMIDERAPSGDSEDLYDAMNALLSGGAKVRSGGPSLGVRGRPRCPSPTCAHSERRS